MHPHEAADGSLKAAALLGSKQFCLGTPTVARDKGKGKDKEPEPEPELAPEPYCPL